MSCRHIFFSSISSNTSTFSISTLVLPHLFGLLLADHQYIDKSHINVLLGATVYTRFLEGAFIKGILNQPLTTPSALVCWLSVEIPATGTYRATHNSSFNPVQNCSTGKFFQIYHLQAITPVDILYNYRRQKCNNHFLFDQPTKFDKVKVRLSPYNGHMMLRFWAYSTTALQRLLSHPSQRRGFVANRRLANDNYLHSSHVQKYGCYNPSSNDQLGNSS